MAALALAAVLAGCGGSAREAPRAEDGVLDLRDYTFEEPLPLRGPWRAALGPDSLAFADFDYDATQWRSVLAEGYFEEQGFPDEGLVWYRLRLRLPPGTPPLAGYIQHADNAHALYVSLPDSTVQLVAASGKAGASPTTTRRSRTPVVFTLPAADEMVLTWKVANFDYRGGGPFYTPLIGPQEQIYRFLLARVLVTYLTLALFWCIGLALLVYWTQNRSDARALAVSVLALLMGFRTLVVSATLDYLFADAFTFELRIALEGLSVMPLPGVIGLLLWSFFPKEFASLRFGPFTFTPTLATNVAAYRLDVEARPLLPQPLRVVNTLSLLVALFVSLSFLVATLAGRPEITSYLFGIWKWMALLLVVLAVVVITEAGQRRRPEARTLAFGFSLLALGVVHDVLLSLGVIRNQPYLASFAFVPFVLVLSYAVVRLALRASAIAQAEARRLQEQLVARTRELEAATIAAQAANLAKSQFLSAVSHELRTPLTSILGYTQILEEELTPSLRRPHREFFAIVRRSGDRLLSLINDLLDLAKIEAGKLDLTIEPVAVEPIVEEVRAQLYPLAADKQLTLTTEIAASGAHVLADPGRLRQVLINLLSNAVKFTDQGTVYLRVGETRLNGRTAVTIAVADTGPGISPDFMPHLFDRFTQEAQAYGKTQRGTGLGLTITRELVHRMEGEIHVESELEHGSTFTVVLPSPGPADFAAREEEARQLPLF